ncbi:MAG: TIGR04283 family arsenosugar biosynthesis glycosyltransferase [Desulfomonilia bacterium]
MIFTRYPEPGKTKTRLIPMIGEQGAADLHREMTLRVLAMMRNLALMHGIMVEVHYDGGTRQQMKRAFGHDFLYIRQAAGDIGRKMENAFERAFSFDVDRGVLIGTDCPEISGDLITQAFMALDKTDAVFGPAHDGGYYLVGLHRNEPQLFRNIPWGTAQSLDTTLQRAFRAGMQTQLLRKLTDIDRPEDIPIWQDLRNREPQEVISVIIPTLNEERAIARTIQNLRKGSRIEIIVVDAESSDGTRSVARESGARVISSGNGRALQMNRGAQEAAGNILLFLHADTLLPPGYDRAIRDALRGNDSLAGSFRFRFDVSSASLRLIQAGANLRTRKLRLPYGDQGLFMNKEFFLRIGGYPDMPILEDVALVKEIQRKGHLIILPLDAVTSSRRYDSLGVFRTWLINWMVYAGYFAGMPLEEIALLYKARASLMTWSWRLMRVLVGRHVPESRVSTHE